MMNTDKDSTMNTDSDISPTNNPVSPGSAKVDFVDYKVYGELPTPENVQLAYSVMDKLNDMTRHMAAGSCMTRELVYGKDEFCGKTTDQVANRIAGDLYTSLGDDWHDKAVMLGCTPVITRHVDGTVHAFAWFSAFSPAAWKLSLRNRVCVVDGED